MRPNSPLRTVLMASCTLALAIGFYAFYQYSSVKEAPEDIPFMAPSSANTDASKPPAPDLLAEALRDPKPPEPAKPMPNITAAIPSAESPSIAIGKQGTPISGSENARFTAYDDEGNTRFAVEVAEWSPVKGASDEVDLRKPTVRLRTPRGQHIRAVADTGHLVLKVSGGRNAQPVRGSLAGNVRITVDRLTEQQRAALPPDERDVLDESRRVDIEVDSVTFDLELSRVTTDGRFDIKSAEARVEGTGLMLRYNELDSRIEQLEIQRDGRIRLDNIAGALPVDVLSAQASPESVIEPSDSTPKTAAEKSSDPQEVEAQPAATDESAIPVLVLDEPREPTKRPTDIYTATFAKDVRVTQFSDEVEVGRLIAGLLEISFEFGQRERSIARTNPALGGGDDSDATKDATAPEAEAAKTGSVLLTWSGLLKVRSERQPESQTAEGEHKPRVHITAEGNPLEVSDPDRRVSGAKLVYHDETGNVWIYGTPDMPARVSSSQTGSLTAVELTLDRESGEINAQGPGGSLEMAGAATGAPGGDGGTSRVTFEDHLIARFKETVSEKLDPETGEMKSSTRRTLDNAIFTGDVVMHSGEETIECQRIDIEFGTDYTTDPRGKLYPKRAEAFRDIRAARGDRYIHAGDRLVVDIGMFPADKPPFDLQKARAVAAAKGHDPQALDWDKIRSDYENQREPGIERVQAFGAVEVRDPVQKLAIDAAELDCSFAGGRKIERGLVTPGENRDAFVALGDFSIASPEAIPFDVVAQTVNVAGPGKMTFPVTQDLGGAKLDAPVLANIVWSKSLNFTGAENRAIFRGDVHAQTDDSDFRAPELRIDFRDLDLPDRLESSSSDQIDFWIFDPLVHGGKTERNERIELAGPQVNKEPILIYASGGATVVTQSIDAETDRLKSRLLITGETLSVDLQQRIMSAEKAGQLLIEDYRSATRTVRPASAGSGRNRVTPFGRLSFDEPSQTYVSWASTMVYRYGINVAQFEEDVQLFHRTGSMMKHAESFVDDEQLQPTDEGGREASLRCGSLVVRFARGATDGEAGAGRLSGNEVDAFQALDKVYFEDSGISAVANEMTYNRQDATLQILGTEEDHAQLFDQRKRFTSLKGPKFYWDRRTNQIKAPKSRGSMK